jgi:hypothetical protein
MKQFEYKEMVMSNKITLIDQINEQGLYGWEFVIQAQRVTPNRFSVNGQPQMDIVLIYKREIQSAVIVDKEKN